MKERRKRRETRMERRRRRRRRRHRSGSSPLPPPPLNRHLSSTPTTVPIPPRRRRSRSPRPCFRRRTPAVTARSARLRVSVSDLDFARLDFESNEKKKQKCEGEAAQLAVERAAMLPSRTAKRAEGRRGHDATRSAIEDDGGRGAATRQRSVTSARVSFRMASGDCRPTTDRAPIRPLSRLRLRVERQLLLILFFSHPDDLFYFII